MVTAGAGACSLATEGWAKPSSRHAVFLALAGTFLTGGHAALLFAYRIGSTAVIAPFFYSLALWGVVSGLIVWGALPNETALVGIGMIAASGVLIVLTDGDRGRGSPALGVGG